MNRFDREYWDGAREMALMFYDSIKSRKDVPRRISRNSPRRHSERRENGRTETSARRSESFTPRFRGAPPRSREPESIAGSRQFEAA